MSSGVEADIALDAAVIMTLGLNRALGHAAEIGAAGAEALARFAAARAAAKRGELDQLERFDRAVRDVLDANARIMALAESQRAAAERFGVRPAALPQPLTVDAQSPEELAEWAARTGAAIVEAERALSGRIAEAVAGRLFPASAAGLTTAVGGDPTAEAAATHTDAATDAATDAGPAEAAGAAGRTEVAETLARVIGRLPPDTAEADYRHVTEAAERAVLASTPGATDGLLTEVRLRVQRANENTERRRAELAREAAEREAREQEEAERRYVLDTITTAFADMGYDVDAGFETMTAHDGEVFLTRDEWPQHAIKMRLDDANQLRAAMLRTEPPRGDDDRRLDAEREQQWCAAFENARARLAAAGVRSDVRWRLEPGVRQLPVTETPRRARRPAATTRRQQRRPE